MPRPAAARAALIEPERDTFDTGHLPAPAAGVVTGDARMEGRSMASTTLKSIVTGTVWKIERQAGEVVMNLESMTMEIPIEAPLAGVVRDLLVADGEAVTEGQPLAALDS